MIRSLLWFIGFLIALPFKLVAGIFRTVFGVASAIIHSPSGRVFRITMLGFGLIICVVVPPIGIVVAIVFFAYLLGKAFLEDIRKL